MKKFKILSLMILTLFTVLAVSACDFGGSSGGRHEEKPNQEHVHNAVIEEAVSPTCTTSGRTEGSHCSICGEVLVESQYLSELGHTPVTDPGTPATCTEDGLSDGSHCSVCDEIITSQYTVYALGHSLEYHSGMDPTCYDGGWNYYETCSRCDYTTYQALDKLEHNPTDWIIDTYAQLGVEGKKHIECHHCGLVMQEETIPAAVASVGLEFTSTTAGALVSGIGSCNDTNIIVPDKTDSGETVVGIADYAFNYAYSVESISLPDTVTFIGADAFRNCSSLVNIIIPDGVTSIGSHAFDNCLNLKSLFIPENVKDIGGYAFTGCSNLQSINIPLNIKEIKEYTFANCVNLGSVSIPANVTSIGEGSFENCSSLTKISLPEGLENLGYCAFQDCIGLTNVEIPAGLESMGNSVFYGCSSLESVMLPFILSPNGSSAFYDVFGGEYNIPSTLKTVVITGIMSGYTEIEDSTFANLKYIESITLPEGITFIGNNAFYGCEALKKLSIPSSLEAIGSAVFDACTSLETYPYDNALYIGNESDPYIILLSAAAQDITACDVHSSARLIYESAFSYCSELNRVALPEGLTYIGEHAFFSCTSLNTVNIPSTLSSIGRRAFRDCYSIRNVYITDIEKWCSIELGADESSPLSHGGTIYLNGERVTNLVIPEGITYIPKYAFGSTSILTVSIPSTVEYIEENAFSSCVNLIEVANASSLNITAGSHDHGYIALYALHVYDPETEGSTIIYTPDGYMFCSSDSQTYLVSYAGNASDLTLPESFDGNAYSIRQYAFAGNTNLTNVTIPNTVTNIGKSIFEGCFSMESLSIPFIGSPDASRGNCYLGALFGGYSYSSNAEYVPDTLKSVSVTNATAIADKAFYGCSDITEIYISEGVETIGLNAFENCRSLQSISLPEGLLTVKSNAFNECSSLESIEVPSTVNAIGSGVLQGCDKLNTLTLPFTGASSTETNKNFFGYIFGAQNASDVYTYIPNSLETVILTNDETIDSYAFRNCTNIKSITLPDNLKTIGMGAFYQCSSLASIDIPDSVEMIDAAAFSGCSALESVVIPEKVSSIGNNAFLKCEKLKEITFKGALLSVGTSAFEGCTSLKALDLPATVSQVGMSAFKDCASLESVTIPYAGNSLDGSTQTNITLGYFFGASASNIYNHHTFVPATLKHVKVLGGGIVGFDAFAGCKKIESIELCGDITQIGISAFANCSALKTVIIPSDATYIGKKAFYACSSLETVEIPASLEYIGEDAFNMCTLLNITSLPSTLSFIGGNAFDESGIVFAEYSDGFYLGNTQTPKLVLIRAKSTDITSFTFDSSTRIVYTGAFAYCKELTSIDIPSTVINIGNFAFRSSGLESISIPASVTALGTNVFYDCTKLENATIPEGMTVIPSSAFEGCVNLTSFTVPSTVYKIEDGAFADCHRLYEVYNNSSLNIYRASSAHGGIAKNALYVYTAGQTSKLETTGDGFVFVYNDISNEYNLVGYVGASHNLVLPDTYNGQNYTIGYNAFRNNTWIHTVHLGKGVTSISGYAFAECPNLYKVTAPVDSELTAIHDYAFYLCGNLASLTLPKNLTVLGHYSLDGCYVLVEVCNDSIIKNDDINNKKYGGTNYALMNKYTSTSGSSRVSLDSNGYLFYDYGSEAAILGYIGDEKDIVLPDDFNGMPLSVISRAFFRSDITSVYIPNGVTSIGEWAFAECDELESIEFAERTQKLTTQMSAFQICPKLTEVTLAEGVENVAPHLFSSCTGLTTLYLPSTIVGVGSGGVSNCSNLTSIYFNGTVNQWNSINKNFGGSGVTWDINTGDYTIYCTDGTITK